ncbi:MAG TPA: hypothetical protein VN328_03105, partial [Thermodesulfovibrionales bacterium]|nr:hypothetical protein [Thermodesulfovibrionales bacterium]
GWHDIITEMNGRGSGPDLSCLACEKINLCGYCPAFFRLETGAEDMRSEYLCRMGHLRYQRMRSKCEEGAGT